MVENGPEGGKTRPEEVAAYIAAITAEMVRLSRKHNLSDLAHLLEMARMEAMERSGSGRAGDSQRIA